MRSKPIVIKFGGEIAESPGSLKTLLHAVKELHETAERVILVHGGGPMATKLSEKLGLQPVIVGGRRVTCEKTLEIMKMTLPGIINTNIIAMMKQMKLPGVPASAINILKTVKRPPKVVTGGGDKPVDFGFVGDIKGADPEYLGLLCDNGLIPVVSPLCADENGVVLNVNADTIAAHITDATAAKEIVMITEIGGVFRDIKDPASRIARIKVSEAKALIKEGVIEGGMIPKIEEGIELLKKNLQVYHIMKILKSDALTEEILNPGSIGTAILPD